MANNDDDLTPEQRGAVRPLGARERRDRLGVSGRGRMLRARSWLTILIGLAALGVGLVMWLGR